MERYREGRSRLHRVDPRVKLVAALAFIAAVTATPPAAWPVLLGLAALEWAAVSQSGVPVLSVLRRSVVAVPFMLIAAPSVFTRPGEAIAQLHILSWTLTASREGLVFFVSVLVKSWISVIATGLLVSTTPFEDLLRALRFLRLPRLLVAVVSSMYRYSFVLVDEAQRLLRARASRSARAARRSGGPIRWRAEVVGSMVGSLFVRTYERSERIHQAMLSRGYAGALPAMADTPLSPGRWAVLACILLGLAAVEAFAAVRW
ncbi:MAG: cobalt ECF transporter T component CbiQ [Chloroflexota bacterium]|nr:cobalt ECF transporter T component CbiQ [Chloroflexota bacterium]